MNSAHSPLIAVVMPCYNEEKSLPHALPTILNILERLKAAGEISRESYVLCVDDGSKDGTWRAVSDMSAANRAVRGIALAHNRGHQFALYAGLMEARIDCDAAISIDADLQDDPEAIVEMIGRFKQGNEIVYGVRRSRSSDSWFKRNSARAFYKLQSAMGLETLYDHADFRLMSRRALDILAQYGEQNLFLRGIIPQIGLDSAIVYYDRDERVAGESKYPLSRMIAFSIDGITSFSSKPMRWIFTLGLLLLVLDLVVAAYVLIAFFMGRTIDGWSSIMLSVWFLGSLILIGMGIMGEYIGKIFIETKQRPRYNIKERTPREE